MTPMHTILESALNTALYSGTHPIYDKKIKSSSPDIGTERSHDVRYKRHTHTH